MDTLQMIQEEIGSIDEVNEEIQPGSDVSVIDHTGGQNEASGEVAVIDKNEVEEKELVPTAPMEEHVATGEDGAEGDHGVGQEAAIAKEANLQVKKEDGKGDGDEMALGQEKGDASASEVSEQEKAASATGEGEALEETSGKEANHPVGEESVIAEANGLKEKEASEEDSEEEDSVTTDDTDEEFDAREARKYSGCNI